MDSTTLTFLIISTLEIFKDLYDCIETGPTKIAKRQERLKLLCAFLNYPFPEQFVETIPHVAEVNQVIIAKELREFISHIGDTSNQRIITLKGVQDEKHKKFVDAELTKLINIDHRIYTESTQCFCELEAAIKTHPKFAQLYSEKKIIPHLKGSVAARLVLQEKYPQFSTEIQKLFAPGGDNDTNILIDPSLENFDEVHSSLCEFVQEFLQHKAAQLNIQSLVLEKAKTIESITLHCSENEDVHLPISASERNNFHILFNAGQQQLVKDDNRGIIHCTRNSTLKFLDHIGRQQHFELIRLKVAYETLTGKPFAAEFLDVAIPYRDDEKSRNFSADIKLGGYLLRAHLHNRQLILE